MKIYASLPLKHISDLKKYVDGLFYKEEDLTTGVISRLDHCELDRWLEVSTEELIVRLPCSPSLVFIERLRLAPQLMKKDFRVAGVWKGGRSLKIAIMNVCHEIAYHLKARYRSKPSPENTANIIYYGFRNLDELRSNPPKALIITELPVLATFGINISERERRPKVLESHTSRDYNEKFTDREIELMIGNLKNIREATLWHTTR